MNDILIFLAVVVGTMVIFKGLSRRPRSMDYVRHRSTERDLYGIKRELERSESERRATVREYKRLNEEIQAAEKVLGAIRKAAVRDEKERQWVIRDIDLCQHKGGEVASKYLGSV